MKSPFVSRAIFEAACARADAEHENAQFLRREITHQAEAWSAALKAEQVRHDETRARLHEVTSSVSGIAEQLTAPKPVNLNAPAPDFQSFPPLVASALAVATAGFKKDQVREIYIWAEAELAGGAKPDDVAATLRRGLPVDIDADELH